MFKRVDFSLTEELYEDSYMLAAYNKLTHKEPDTVSSIVREAIDQYLSTTDDSYRSFVPKTLEASMGADSRDSDEAS